MLNILDKAFNSHAARLVMIVVLVAYVVAQFDAPFRDHDPLIYILGGRGIYDYGILPYGFVFDHKPALIYVFYGLLSLIDFHFYELRFASIVLLLIGASIVYRLYLRASVPFSVVLFVVAAGAVGSVGYSGNSELLYVLFELLSIHFALTSSARPNRLIASALFAVVAFNTNYICGFALFPVLIFAIYSTSPSISRFVIRLCGYGVTCITLMAVLITILVALGTDLEAYFGMQRQFLASYSELVVAPSPTFLVKLAILLAIIMLPLLPFLRPEKVHRPIVISMVILMVASATSFFLSGKYFPHYLYMVAAPAMIILLCLRYRGVVERSAIAVFLTVVCAGYAVKVATFVTTKHEAPADLMTPYTKISNIVGTDKLMSMRASIVPLYFSKAFPFQPLVWEDHAGIIYGPKEDAYFLKELALGPKFVMTSAQWCDRHGTAWKSCAMLKTTYTMVMTFAGNGETMPSYDLYAIKPKG